MGFQLTNRSNNPLKLSDGRFLSPGESRKLRSVSDRERGYESRGWLSIVEDVKPAAKETVKTAPSAKSEAGGDTK